MEDDCASVVVLRSSSIPPASVAGVEDRFPRSRLEGTQSILDLNELPGSGGYSLLVVSPCRWVQGSLWLGGVAVKLMRRAEFFFSP
ncbi:hypothetical protein YC2023_048784 [Brassica napus]